MINQETEQIGLQMGDAVKGLFDLTRPNAVDAQVDESKRRFIRTAVATVGVGTMAALAAVGGRRDEVYAGNRGQEVPPTPVPEFRPATSGGPLTDRQMKLADDYYKKNLSGWVEAWQRAQLISGRVESGSISGVYAQPFFDSDGESVKNMIFKIVDPGKPKDGWVIVPVPNVDSNGVVVGYQPVPKNQEQVLKNTLELKPSVPGASVEFDYTSGRFVQIYQGDVVAEADPSNKWKWLSWKELDPGITYVERAHEVEYRFREGGGFKFVGEYEGKKAYFRDAESARKVYAGVRQALTYQNQPDERGNVRLTTAVPKNFNAVFPGLTTGSEIVVNPNRPFTYYVGRSSKPADAVQYVAYAVSAGTQGDLYAGIGIDSQKGLIIWNGSGSTNQSGERAGTVHAGMLGTILNINAKAKDIPADDPEFGLRGFDNFMSNVALNKEDVPAPMNMFVQDRQNAISSLVFK